MGCRFAAAPGMRRRDACCILTVDVTTGGGIHERCRKESVDVINGETAAHRVERDPRAATGLVDSMTPLVSGIDSAREMAGRPRP